MKKKAVDKKFVTVDDRGRISLVGLNPASHYEVSKGDDGELILFPVEVVPAYLAARMRELAGSGALNQ